MTLRRLKFLIIAYALLGAGLVGVVILTSLLSLRDIRSQSEHEHNVTNVMVARLAEARLQMVQIQQYMSDAAVTQLDESRSDALAALQQAQALLREVGDMDPSLTKGASDISVLARQMYETGLTMVDAYRLSREQGNAIMKGDDGFDRQAEQLITRTDQLGERVANLQAAAVVAGYQQLDWSSKLILALGMILALLGLWAGAVQYRLVIGAVAAREQALLSLQQVLAQLQPLAQGPGAAATADIGQLSNTILQLVQEREQSRALTHQAKEAAEASDRAKTQFLANLSHEVRTPLNGILGMAEMLEISGPLEPEQLHSLQHLKASAQELLDMLLRMLDYAQLEAGKADVQLRPFAPQAMLQTLAQRHGAAAAEKGLILKVESAPGVPDVVLGDERRIVQLLSELIDNGIKFTSAGSVTVKAEPWLEDGNEVGQAGPWMRYCVADTGPGIPPEQRDLVFRAFTQGDGSVTRSQGGNGLGLALARALSHIMGGRLEVQCPPEGGSRFSLYLPAPPATD